VSERSQGTESSEHRVDEGISEQPAGHLPDDAVVIRGGEMKRKTLMLSATKYEATYPGEYGLTFWSWPGMTADEIALRVGGDRLMHPSLRKCTAGLIRSLQVSDGRPLDLVRTGQQEGHYTLLLPCPPTDDDLDRLSQLFDPPQPNPAAPRGGRGHA
jgi:hypothetical protein